MADQDFVIEPLCDSKVEQAPDFSGMDFEEILKKKLLRSVLFGGLDDHKLIEIENLA
jgi:hypothetical protein